MSKREAILEATKALLWEKGFEATSPRDIQQRSGAGQGSFYHHFRSKRELAAEAMDEVVEDRIQRFEAIMAGDAPAVERIGNFLVDRSDALAGCRVGRMVWDAAVGDERLRRPVERYFRHLERRFTEELRGAAEAGEIRADVDCERTAALIVAAIQGGYTMARAEQSPEALNRATEGARMLLRALAKQE
ncbi:TetR/AcrR family transcriptional regulator [Ectothiorhodospiraceae bacterium WFHF3C12]|nr:TetR/AcrR family transcriptional regulator [Ectothiorhodospiraceae bacterium WFHF3C12]